MLWRYERLYIMILVYGLTKSNSCKNWRRTTIKRGARSLNNSKTRRRRSGFSQTNFVNKWSWLWVDKQHNPQTIIEKLSHSVWCAQVAEEIVIQYFFKNEIGHNVAVNVNALVRSMINDFLFHVWALEYWCGRALIPSLETTSSW